MYRANRNSSVYFEKEVTDPALAEDIRKKNKEQFRADKKSEWQNRKVKRIGSHPALEFHRVKTWVVDVNRFRDASQAGYTEEEVTKAVDILTRVKNAHKDAKKNGAKILMMLNERGCRQ